MGAVRAVSVGGGAMWAVRVTVVVAVAALTVASVSAQTPEGVRIWGLFTQGRYGEYLGQLDHEIGNKAPDWLRANLPKIVAVAVSLDKARSWGTPQAMRAERWLAVSPDALRYFNATKRILGGDLGAVGLYFQGEAPNYSVWQALIPVLRQHGYAGPADAFAAVLMTGYGGVGIAQPAGVTEAGLKGLAAVSETQRQALLAVLQERMKGNWYRQAEIGRKALDMAVEPSGDVDKVGAYSQIAIDLGRQSGSLSLDAAARLARAGRRHEAGEMALALAAAQPADAQVQARAAGLLWDELGDVTQGATLYQRALASLPEPDVWDVRIQYFARLQAARKNQQMAFLCQQLSDPIADADALLVAAKYQDAATGYRRVLEDGATPPLRQVMAWAGLLASVPDAALGESGMVTEHFATAVPALRARLIDWLGVHLWRAIETELRGGRPVSTDVISVGRRLGECQKWEPRVAAAMERLIAVDEVSFLRPRLRREPPSLRFPAATAFALSGQVDKALLLLKREIQCEVAPPPSGWMNPPGVAPPPDADKPRLLKTPRDGEAARQMVDLVRLLGQCPNTADRVPVIAACIVGDLAADLGKETQGPGAGFPRRLADVLRLTAQALDPQPAPDRSKARTPGDPAAFEPLGAAVREALKSEAGAGAVPVLLRDGVQPALLSAVNPKLLDALTALALDALDRHAAVAGAEKARAEAASLAGALEARKAPDMKPYAVRLRERFPG